MTRRRASCRGPCAPRRCAGPRSGRGRTYRRIGAESIGDADADRRACFHSRGLDKAIERGTERGCESIQIFNQSPRMWRPTQYGPEDFAAFNEAMDGSPVEAVVIHAVYLINCATKDKELRKKSLASLTHALRIGDAIGAAGVVLHPGAQKGEPLGPSMKRAGKSDRRGARGQRQLPAAARADRRPQRPARPRLRPDRRADRAGRQRQAPRPLPRLLPPLRPGLRRHRPRAPGRRSSTKPTRRSASTGCAASTSTTPPPRSAPAATATPTSARARWANRASPPSSPSPASRACRRRWRPRARTRKAPDKKEVQAAKRLRKAGLKRRQG